MKFLAGTDTVYYTKQSGDKNACIAEENKNEWYWWIYDNARILFSFDIISDQLGMTSPILGDYIFYSVSFY